MGSASLSGVFGIRGSTKENRIFPVKACDRQSACSFYTQRVERNGCWICEEISSFQSYSRTHAAKGIRCIHDSYQQAGQPAAKRGNSGQFCGKESDSKITAGLGTRDTVKGRGL